jgi:hypothetical protein
LRVTSKVDNAIRPQGFLLLQLQIPAKAWTFGQFSDSRYMSPPPEDEQVRLAPSNRITRAPPNGPDETPQIPTVLRMYSFICWPAPSSFIGKVRTSVDSVSALRVSSFVRRQTAPHASSFSFAVRILPC